MSDYRFMDDRPDTPPQKHDPGYGEVVASRESITVRRSGDVYSIWCGPQMQITSENAEAVNSFVEGLKGL